MPLHILILQMILAVTLASASMLAATVDLPEEAATQEKSQALDPLWEKRNTRAAHFKSRFLLSRKTVDAGNASEGKARLQRAEHRYDCRESVRKANRDQRLGKLISCMREDLTLTMDMLKARSEVIAVLPGVSPELRGLAIARSELLADAVSTIIDGLDAGVYENEEGLFVVRKNLREKYLLPYWALLPRMEAEQMLSWISHMLLRGKSLAESLDITAKLAEAEMCLANAEAALEAVAGEKDFQKMNIMISQARSTAISCIKIYRDAIRIQEKELAPPEEKVQEPQWQKRSLRKLPKMKN